MVTLYFSHQSLVGRKHYRYGHKESADPVPHIQSGLRQPQIHYGRSLRYGAQLQCVFGFAH